MSEPPAEHALDGLLNQVVVLDTQGPLIYSGTLVGITPDYLQLTEADVHDSNDSRTSKDLYLVETRELGVRANRAQVLVARRHIISMSRLADVQA